MYILCLLMPFLKNEAQCNTSKCKTRTERESSFVTNSLFTLFVEFVKKRHFLKKNVVPSKNIPKGSCKREGNNKQTIQQKIRSEHRQKTRYFEYVCKIPT